MTRRFWAFLAATGLMKGDASDVVDLKAIMGLND
jgi:hypothetical protein